jgi:hypothetical protein
MTLKTRIVSAIGLLPLSVSVIGLLLVSVSGPTSGSIIESATFAAFAFVIYVMVPFSVYVTIRRGEELVIVGRISKVTVGLAIAVQALTSFITYAVMGNTEGLVLSLAISTAIFICVFYLNRFRLDFRRKGPSLLEWPNVVLTLYFGVIPWSFELLPALETMAAVYFACAFTFAFAYYFSSAQLQYPGI